MSAALDSNGRRGVERLLEDCATLERVEEPNERRPVVDRLRDLLGNDLARLLLFGLAGQRGGAARRSG
jgi:hypothetical protein